MSAQAKPVLQLLEHHKPENLRAGSDDPLWSTLSSTLVQKYNQQGPSFAYSLPLHAFHTRRDRVASLTTCCFAWRGHTKRLATRARPSPDLAVWLE